MAARAVSALAAIALGALLSGCGTPPLRPTIPTLWRPSANFDARRPSYVIIHYTSNGTVEPALRTLTQRGTEVSAHFLVVRDGTILQLVDERARAWHAGASHWGDSVDLNSESLGIELDNDGEEAYPQVQIDALIALLKDFGKRYRIPGANYLGHSDVAPRRKVDPGRAFPWRRLAAEGFGVWCDDAPPADTAFDEVLGLRAFGYDVADPDTARGAFKLHYVPDEEDAAWTSRDRDTLACVLAAKRALQER